MTEIEEVPTNQELVGIKPDYFDVTDIKVTLMNGEIVVYEKHMFSVNGLSLLIGVPDPAIKGNWFVRHAYAYGTWNKVEAIPVKI